MSRICPITNEMVLYTECTECDERICRTDKKQNSSINKEEIKDNNKKWEVKNMEW